MSEPLIGDDDMWLLSMILIAATVAGVAVGWGLVWASERLRRRM